jgi:CelD/BcsL family acetyltransferase involved in cellulose biosynthesis
VNPALERVAPAHPVADEAYSVAPLTTLAAVEGLAAEWSRLEQRSSRPCFFQSATWSLAACRHFAAQDGAAFQPAVLSVRRGRELVAVAPLRIVQRGPVRLAIDLTDPFGQYGDVLIDDACDADAIVTEILAALRAMKGIDALLMRRVRADSPMRGLLTRGGFEASGRDAAPLVDLRAHTTFESYHQTINPRTRKTFRNARHRLGRIAPVSHRVFEGDGLREVIAQSFQGRLRWLDQHGFTSTAFDNPAFYRFLERVRELGRRGELDLLAMGIYCGDEPMSFQWGFVHRGRYYAYIGARNPAFDDYGPGRLHMEDIIRTCHERGVLLCDFLAPAVRYKFTFTDQATEVVDVAVPFTLVGRIVLDMWNRRLKATAKTFYTRLPERLRRFVRQLVTASSRHRMPPADGAAPGSD